MTGDANNSAGGRKRLVLIDGNSLLYRAFFALPPLTNAQGQLTNAAYGFTTMLLKVLDEQQPEMAAVAFDLPGPTFRHELFDEYKATRRAMPDELAPQFGMAREILDALRIPVYELKGYEADDVIGTLARQAEARGEDVLIVTGDLDELQLVSEHISVMVTRRGATDVHLYDIPSVKERYGLTPAQLPDFRALRGDTSDNIPGVPGIGEKTAAQLIGEFGSLENLLARLDQAKPDRAAAALETHAEIARRAKTLSVIVTDLPLPYDPEALRLEQPDGARLAGILRRLDFRSLAKRFEPVCATTSEDFTILESAAGVAEFVGQLDIPGELILHLVPAPGSTSLAPLLALALACEGQMAVLLPGKERMEELLLPLAPLLSATAIPKSGHDLKNISLALAQNGLKLTGLSFDTMLAAYLVDPTRSVGDLSTVVSEYLEIELPPTIVAGAADPVAVATAVRKIGELQLLLQDRLASQKLEQLYREIELPLVPVLLEMEQTGIAVDLNALAELSDRLGARAGELESDIHALAGESFNIGSPQQLGRILFEKLALPPNKTKRTKTGYSTSADVLASLTDYEIVAKVLEYREITKLKSTYVDALPRLVNPKTGRLHTSFNQAVTATGRLSSTNPNLQNIPIRTPLGTEVRRAFIAGKPDHLLLSADYSQIELRILAHITGDENLIEIFRKDEDLHRAAAMEIFGVGQDEVTTQMRAFAKMVNFGIPYGMSDFRLSREMNISMEEARQYMARYFARFPKVQEYVASQPARARELGYVTTLLGRRRPVPELRSSVPAVRQAAERIAINTPMQGSAADIIKVAMLHLQEIISRENLGARLLLQVHDELVLETPEAELPHITQVVQECMSNAYDLLVPLKVDVKVGPNWLDMINAA